LNSDDAVAAALVHPNFAGVSWADDIILERGRLRLNELFLECPEASTVPSIPTESNMNDNVSPAGVKDKLDFFSFLRPETNPDEQGNDPDLLRHTCYFENFVEDVKRLRTRSQPFVGFDIMKKYKCISKIFIRFNTAPPSSAAVERVFSVASHIFTKERNNLTDEHFEERLLCQYAKNLRKYREQCI